MLYLKAFFYYPGIDEKIHKRVDGACQVWNVLFYGVGGSIAIFSIPFFLMLGYSS